MIAGCIDKLRHEACGDCDRRDACASLFAGLFGPGGAFAARPDQPRRRGARAAAPVNPFLSFIGQVARAIEAQAAARPRPRPKAQPQPQPQPQPEPQPGRFAREVEAHVEPLLASGEVRIGEVARALGVSRQTLYRRLKAEGATFESILDRVRKRLALRLIREGRPVKDVAYRLGFSDPAAFSRAFKRWTGTSPSAARR